jgi:hypothetical protein
VRVVLVDQVDLLDVRLVLHEGGQRLHLHRGVGVEAEVPVAALAVGQVGVDRGVVEVEHFLAGLRSLCFSSASMMASAGTGAVALHHVAGALVHGRAQRAGGFLRAQLVVDADDLELHAGGVLLVELLGQELEGLELVGAHRSHQARQRIEPGDLDGLALLGHAPRPARGDERGGDEAHLRTSSHLVSPGSVFEPEDAVGRR